jgi:hypothetical protein
VIGLVLSPWKLPSSRVGGNASELAPPEISPHAETRTVRAMVARPVPFLWKELQIFIVT